jgi:hypothetical protein
MVRDVALYSFAVGTLSNYCRRTAENPWNGLCQRHTKKFPSAGTELGMLLCFETDEVDESDEELIHPFPR